MFLSICRYAHLLYSFAYNSVLFCVDKIKMRGLPDERKSDMKGKDPAPVQMFLKDVKDLKRESFIHKLPASK